ncbi:transcriptional regulator, AsnC family [Archaeoglobus sulfaticallidus PM70-1]|uniref:Transcriptional regulator, AsnC family n=1 Tax=Archaeoglobus sulfaticallidus PM70-1 TaxID=387631 RepID=N0BD72_9EURY|nr:Lrp/AsnC ligand binding domain-containing protein [Archaeoglobus sulfaticallidus]AGK61554.1 transcriptional regulator, AsnC family [Archaeoglobus sulfaticallidus PM70-1]
MALGFVLVKISPKKEKEVYEKLAELEEIEELYPLFGEYDLIAKIVVRDFEELSDVVVNKIRSLDGVIETKTLTGAKF